MAARSVPQYQSILDNAPVGIYQTDPVGSISYANHTLLRLLNFSSLTDLQNSPNQPRPGSALVSDRERQASADVSRFQTTWTKKDGTPVRVRENARTVLATDGQVRYIEASVEELTGDDLNAKPEAPVDDRYQKVVDNLKEVVFQVDAKGDWVFLNPAWKNVTGYEVEASIGTNFLVYVYPDDREAVLGEFRRLVGGEMDFRRLELRYTTKDGRSRWVEVYARTIRDGKGVIVGVSGTLTDFTDRKQVEDALRDSEMRYRKVIEISPNGILIHDKGRILYANPASVTLMRAASAEELYAVPLLDFVHPDSREVVRKRFATMTDAGESVPVIEERFLRLDGTIMDVEVAAAPLVDAGRNVFLVVVRDITERKTAERALRESEERYRTVVASLHEAVILQDGSGTIIDCNRNAERILGIERKKIIGENRLASNQTLLDHTGTPMPPDNIPSTVCLRTGKPVLGIVMGIPRKGNMTTWIRVNAQPLLAPGASVPHAVATSFTDITKEREALKTLEYQAELFDFVSDAVISTDKDFRIASWNRSAEQRYEWTRQEAIGKDVYGLLKVEFPAMSRDDMLAHLRDSGVVDLEVIHTTKSGKKIDVSALITRTRDGKGDVSGSVGILRDISERKRVEAILREREQLLEMMFQRNTAVMLLVDPESGAIVDANPAAAAFYGMTLDRLKSTSILDINSLPGDQVRQLFTQALGGGRNTFHVKHRLSNGTVREVEIHASPVMSRGRMILFAIVHDVTDRLETERQLQSSLKEKEVLLKEVYHRVKNNLNVVASLLSLQSRFVKAKEDAALFEETKARIQAMGKVHQNLYQSEHLSAIDFSVYLKDLTESITTSYGPPGVSTELDLEQLSVGLDQAVPCGLIVNELLTNCYKYAFQGRGSGRVSVSCRAAGEALVMLSVQDDGIGLPETVDFTGLKSLGLSLVAMLADQIDGKLTIERSHGTTFTLVFPMSPA